MGTRQESSIVHSQCLRLVAVTHSTKALGVWTAVLRLVCMCCQRQLFTNFVETNESIALACDSYIEAEGKEYTHSNFNLSTEEAIDIRRSWNTTLDAAIRNMGFKPCESEPCIYSRQDNGKFNFIAVYVDDTLIACSDETDLVAIKENISKKFKLVDNGNLKYFLGIEIERAGNTGKISIGHSQYINRVLLEHGMQDSRPASTPLYPGFQIYCNNKKCELVDVNWYQSIIGTLMYLAISTRPDILHSVCKLAQRNQNPHVEHEKAVKHILRYLRSTKHRILQYTKTTEPLKGFVDAYWTSCQEDRKSYTGFTFFLAGCSFSWENKKQPSIALSSTEAEFVALSTAAKEAIYLKRLLREKFLS